MSLSFPHLLYLTQTNLGQDKEPSYTDSSSQSYSVKGDEIDRMYTGANAFMKFRQANNGKKMKNLFSITVASHSLLVHLSCRVISCPLS